MRRAAVRVSLLLFLAALEVPSNAGPPAAGSPARASTWPPAALADVEVSSRAERNAGTGVFTYTLTVSNPASNVLPVDLVEVDVSIPGGRTAPDDFVPKPDPTFDDPFRPFRRALAPGGADSAVYYMRRVSGQDLPRVGLASPPGWHSWLSLSPRESPIGLRPVAGWGHESGAGPTPGISPGSAVSGFRIESSLPPGVRVVLLRPSFQDLAAHRDVPEDWRTSSEDSDAEIEEKNRRVASLDFATATLGPMPPPGWSAASIAQGIVACVDDAAAAGWCPDPAIAAGLRGDAERLVALAAEGDRDRLLAALSAFAATVRALPASRARREAVELLALNAEFLAGRVAKEVPPAASPVVTPR